MSMSHKQPFLRVVVDGWFRNPPLFHVLLWEVCFCTLNQGTIRYSVFQPTPFREYISVAAAAFPQFMTFFSACLKSNNKRSESTRLLLPFGSRWWS